MNRRVYIVYGLLFLALGFTAFAAQQGTTGSEVFSAGSPYAGLSPLDGRPEMFPGSGNPQKCVPPIKTWKLVAQQNGECYYFAPAPINGYITSINNVGALQKFYVKCGVDPFDSTKVICQNPGDDLPGAPPTTGPPAASGISATGRNGEVFAAKSNSGGSNGGTSGGPTTGGGRPGPSGGGPNFNDTQRMPGPAGGIGYTPGPNPCLPKGPGGYDYCANGPGARLPAGCYCDGLPPVPPDGAKTLKRGPPEPGRTEPPASKDLTPEGQPNFLILQKAMNDCLSAKVPYWVPANIQSRYMDMARQGASQAVRTANPQTLPYQTQVFVLETAMAMQAQAFHDRQFGQSAFEPGERSDSNNPAYAPYNLAGWLERCLAEKNLQPDTDMRRPFADFMGVGVMDNRIYQYGNGYVYGDLLSPATLLPPYVPPARNQ